MPKKRTPPIRRKNPDKEVLMVYAPKEDAARVHALCAARSLGITTVLRMALTAGLPIVERTFAKLDEESAAATAK